MLELAIIISKCGSIDVTVLNNDILVLRTRQTLNRVILENSWAI